VAASHGGAQSSRMGPRMISSRQGKLSLAWYFHMPSVMTDEDISEVIRESMSPLVRVHRELNIPFNLAITGVLLKRMENIDGNFLDQLKIDIQNGLVNLMGTFYHEIFPPIVPCFYLSAHVAKDIELKQKLLSVTPRSFFLANYTWVPSLRYIFNKFDYKSIILDQKHFEEATRVQMWRWRFEHAHSMNSYLAKTTVDDAELRHAYHFEQPDQPFDDWLELRFRATDFVRMLSFGTSGAIHRPTEQHAIRKLAERIKDAAAEFDIVLADDGDRINPVSFPGYEIFLRSVEPSRFALISSLRKREQNVNVKVLPYLPSFSPGSHTDFWLSDLDAVHYQTLMQELYRNHRDAVDERIMELQDVFFLFWKTHHRKQWYVERIMKMLAM
jgi:Glycosyl hydrolase family 57